jgi:leucyl aminopeptidase
MAFIGKGITFDTGGLNIKGTGFMEDMYGDKGGACAVLGALKGSLELKPKLNIVFACAFAENAIGSQVYKPGDIIQAMNGLSVEIGNTDAEGRLVLADTFTYI